MEEQHQPSQLGNYVIDAPTLHNIGGSVNSCTTGRCILPRITDATSLSRGQPSIDDSSTEEKKSPSIRRSSKLWKRIIVCFINFQIITRPLSRNAILSRAIRFDTRQTVLFVVTLTLEDPVLSYSIFYTLSVKYLFLCDWIWYYYWNFTSYETYQYLQILLHNNKILANKAYEIWKVYFYIS